MAMVCPICNNEYIICKCRFVYNTITKNLYK